MRAIRIIVPLVLIAVVGYTGYVGYEGSAQDMAMSPERGMKLYCFTPEMYAGWDYEAVNYDIAADAALPWVDARGAVDGDPELGAAYEVECPDLRGTAGDEIVTADGIRIAAWYIPAEAAIGPTGPTIVLVHGNPSNKSDMLRYAAYLHSDFNVLVPDLRNAGRSSGTMSTTGVLEYQDVIAVVDWLVREKGPEHIGALGDSGGAAAILRVAAAGEDRIGAFVTDSAHGRHSEAVGHFLTTTAEPAHPRYPGLWAIEVGFWIRTGHGFDEADPVDTVASIDDRPYLLLHGTLDDFDHPEASADLIYQAALDAGVPVERHMCEGGTHGRLTSDCADEYAGWVVPFFRDAFGLEASASAR